MEEEKVNTGLGRRLRRIIKARGETLRAFSDKSGVPYRTLQNYLSGNMKPNAEQLTKIALAGIDTNYLLAGAPSKPMLSHLTPKSGMSEEAYAILSDRQILDAALKRVYTVGDHILSEHLKDGSEIKFEVLINIYLRLTTFVVSLLVKADIPFEEARRLGMPLDRLLASALDTAMEAAAVKFADEAARPTAPDIL